MALCPLLAAPALAFAMGAPLSSPALAEPHVVWSTSPSPRASRPASSLRSTRGSSSTGRFRRGVMQDHRTARAMHRKCAGRRCPDARRARLGV